MKLVDANVLLYSVNEDAVHHVASRQWLDDALSGAAPVGFDWVALLAFVRIATHRAIFTNPMSHDDAMAQVRDWLASPSAQVLSPTARHTDVLDSLLRQVNVGGNLVNDAHLAALAIEHTADLVSFDRDFDRFPGVRRIQP